MMMAQRAKAKKVATGATSAARSGKAESGARASAKAGGAASGPGARDVERLEAECQALKAELVAAREEIARLEKRQELVVNRIDWVIDSLHNLLKDEG